MFQHYSFSIQLLALLATPLLLAVQSVLHFSPRIHNILRVDTSPAIRAPVFLETNSDQVAHFSPESNRRLHESHLVSIDGGLLPNKIGVLGLDPCGLVNELPDHKQPWDEQLHGIVGEECGGAPGEVGGVAVDTSHGEHPGKAKVSAPRLEVSAVGERTAVETLDLTGLVESDVCNAHYNVVDQT